MAKIIHLPKPVTERRQPVVCGVADNGELIWTEVDMPRWQMEMLRAFFELKYRGDFMAHWLKLACCAAMGVTSDDFATTSMDVTTSDRHKGRRKPRPTWGD